MERKYWYMGMALAVMLCLVTILWGCQRSTTVILPPETSTDTAFSSAATTEPTSSGSHPTTEPTTVPTTTPTTEPTTAPTTEPTTTPTTEPTTVPTTEPTTAPTTEPTTAPTTEPPTAPTLEPSTAPTTEPTTVPPTEPEPTQHPVYDISGHWIGSLEYGLLDELNKQRAAEELPALTMDSTLCALSTIRAYECTENFSNTRPDGRSGNTVLSDYGYDRWSHLSERIYCGTAGLPASTVVKGWMYNNNFSGCILSESYTHIGIGIYTNGGNVYITCFFA